MATTIYNPFKFHSLLIARGKSEQVLGCLRANIHFPWSQRWAAGSREYRTSSISGKEVFGQTYRIL